MDSPNKAKLGIYTLVRFEGQYYRVDQIGGRHITLTSADEPLLPSKLVKLQTLLSAEDFEICDFINLSSDGSIYEAILDSIPIDVLREAQEMRDHIREAVTGFKSGEAGTAEKAEPQPQYDPQLSSLESRIENKSKELKLNRRQLWRLYSSFRDKGLYGLVDHRRLRTEQQAEQTNPTLVNAIREVVRINAGKSTRSLSVLKREVKAHLTKIGEDPEEHMRSRPIFNRIARKILKGTGYLDSARNHRNYLNHPKKVYASFRAIRPGEFILIDASRFDVMAFDSAGEKIRYRLLLALDLFSRAIVAWRFLEYEPKGVDATLLLYDVLHPLSMDEHWPKECIYPYVGIPETVIVDLFDADPDLRLSSIPPLTPDTVVIDNGKIFLSSQFRDACESLAISIYLSTPYNPIDKSQIERAFRTAAEQLFSFMPGYLGNSPERRGKEADEDAYYFVFEVDRLFGEWANLYNQTPHTGLHHPMVPTIFHTPVEMFDIGVQSTGYYHVPASKNMIFSLLRTVWRRINHYGVEINGIIYNHPDLIKYHNQTSTIEGRKGKWPFKVDDRILSHIYFFDKEGKKWITLQRQFSDHAHLPFNSFHLNQVRKHLISDRSTIEKAKETSMALDRLLTQIIAVDKKSIRNRQEDIKLENSARHIRQAEIDYDNHFLESKRRSRSKKDKVSFSEIISNNIEEIEAFDLSDDYIDDIDSQLGSDL